MRAISELKKWVCAVLRQYLTLWCKLIMMLALLTLEKMILFSHLNSNQRTTQTLDLSQEFFCAPTGHFARRVFATCIYKSCVCVNKRHTRGKIKGMSRISSREQLFVDHVEVGCQGYLQLRATVVLWLCIQDSKPTGI